MSDYRKTFLFLCACWVAIVTGGLLGLGISSALALMGVR